MKNHCPHSIGIAGFTLIELMMTIAILALLLGVAAPSLRDLVLNVRMSGQANDLMTDLAMTRAEAVKRGAWTGICASADGAACNGTNWAVGWIAFADTDSDAKPDVGVPLLKRAPAFDNKNTLVASGTAATVISFRSSGTLPPASTGVTFLLCDERKLATYANDALNRGRRITVSSTGRAVSEPFTCP